jgi:hypothetical protein
MKIGIGGGFGPVRGGVSNRGVGAGCGPLSIGSGGGGCGTIIGIVLVLAVAYWALAWPWQLVHHMARHTSPHTASALAWVAEVVYLLIVLAIGVAVLYGVGRKQDDQS